MVGRFIRWLVFEIAFTGIAFGGLFWLGESTAWTGSFFEREAIEARRSWPLLNPDDLVMTALLDDDVVATDYHVEINIPARRLFLYKGERLLKTYPVAVGSLEHKTPVRSGALREISWNPWWYPPDEEWAKDAVVTPPGPDNPLGRAKMPIGGDIVLHGTNAEGTVGQPVSHGCMRMRNKDIEELAWFFQKQFSNASDESFLRKYRAARRQTFYVKLTQPIPVAILYDRVMIRDKQVVIYPDIYHRSRDVRGQVLEELKTVGIDDGDVDPWKLGTIEQVSGRTTIPISDLLTSSAPSSSRQGF